MSDALTIIERAAAQFLAKPSWCESSARERVLGLLDKGSFEEFIGPEKREISPHLQLFDLPEQFDDGMIVGCGLLNGAKIFVAAQEGRFMGGSFGEVHGAKLTGLLRAARDLKTVPVMVLFDTGGVRLQEANAGEVAIGEIMRALIEARLAGVKVIGLIGGRSGCYGGGGLLAGSCSALAISEFGRLAVSGPDVIETNEGVEEFDSKDKPLVWRTMGGKSRRLIGEASIFLEDNIEAFRAGALHLSEKSQGLDFDALKREQARLEERLARVGKYSEAYDIWAALGAADPKKIPDMATDEFIALADRIKEPRYDAR